MASFFWANLAFLKLARHFHRLARTTRPAVVPNIIMRLVILAIVLTLTSGLHMNASPSTPNPTRRAFFRASGLAAGAALTAPLVANALIDVNSAAAGDFQRYPGLFPTIAAKIVQLGPFKDAKDMYTKMDNEAINARLKQYEKEFTFGKSSGGGDRGTGKRSI